MFIRDSYCISPQETYNTSTIKVEEFYSNYYLAKEPNYNELIPLSLLRRMSKLVRMSIGAGLPLIQKHKGIDSIIIGSSNGSIDKSMRFLSQIINYNEGTLTPTDFIQSTSNCIAGTLALMGKITGYNNTHVNQGLAFESAMLDALMLIQEGESQQLLLGGGEEFSQQNYNIDFQLNQYKKENIASFNLLQSKTSGTIPGEGFAMFVIDSKQHKNSLAKIVDVDMISQCTKKEVADKLDAFLLQNKLSYNDIDALVLGRNGDCENDSYYDYLEQNSFPTITTYVYKHLTGEYYTSTAFAIWLATRILTGETIPKEYLWKNSNKPIQTILLYNNYEGKQHGFTLINKIKKN